MMVQVIARSQPMERVYRDFVERSIRYAMGKFGQEILAVRAIFVDHNGPKGGVDQECRIEVQTRRGAMIAAAVVGETPGHALEGSLRRITRRIRNNLDRRQKKSRTVLNDVLARPEAA